MQRFFLNLTPRRAWVQFWAALLTNNYVTKGITKGLPCPSLNCYACPTAAFACPIGSTQFFIGRHKIPFYVLGVVSLIGIVIGRASCGWFCPFGWFQEWVHKLPVPKLRLSNRFNWTRYVVLVVLVGIVPYLTGQPWFSKLCPAGAVEAAIPTLLLYPEYQAQIGFIFWLKMGILVVFLGWMAVTLRPFCRWVCPLGALWSPFNAISFFRLEVDQARCTGCNQCQAACPVDIPVYETPNSDACIRCLACLRACQRGVITVSTLGANKKEPELERLTP